MLAKLKRRSWCRLWRVSSLSKSQWLARCPWPYPSLFNVYSHPLLLLPLSTALLSHRAPLSQSPARVPFTSLAAWWCSRIPHWLACDCTPDQIVFRSTDTDRFPQIFPSPPAGAAPCRPRGEWPLTSNTGHGWDRALQEYDRQTELERVALDYERNEKIQVHYFSGALDHLFEIEKIFLESIVVH